MTIKFDENTYYVSVEQITTYSLLNIGAKINQI